MLLVGIRTWVLRFCLALSGGRARYTGVRMLEEVHLWGIQKGFMKEGTSEEVLKKNLRKKGAF